MKTYMIKGSQIVVEEEVRNLLDGIQRWILENGVCRDPDTNCTSKIFVTDD